eukprot:NODE_405_length_7994_cov_0.788600.p7 type:complete len:129 gc:universal NODE_405_length_7994_cov_0.788600:5676-6062(+)
MAFTIVLQIIIMMVGGPIFKIAPIDGGYWGLSIGLGFVGLLIGVIARLIPDEVFCCKKHEPERIVMNPERIRWQSAISQVRTELRVFKALRGSRFMSSNSSLQPGDEPTSMDSPPIEMQEMKELHLKK